MLYVIPLSCICCRYDDKNKTNDFLLTTAAFIKEYLNISDFFTEHDKVIFYKIQ